MTFTLDFTGNGRNSSSLVGLLVESSRNELAIHIFGKEYVSRLGIAKSEHVLEGSTFSLLWSFHLRTIENECKTVRGSCMYAGQPMPLIFRCDYVMFEPESHVETSRKLTWEVHRVGGWQLNLYQGRWSNRSGNMWKPSW